jgi:hypothetical protein
MSLTLTNRHPTLKPSPPWRRQAKRGHDTPLPFNFIKYFLSSASVLKIRPTRCGATGSTMIAFVTLMSRHSELDGGKRLNARTLDIFCIEKHAGTSIEFHFDEAPRR